jgi:phage tail tape-measure protein
MNVVTSGTGGITQINKGVNDLKKSGESMRDVFRDIVALFATWRTFTFFRDISKDAVNLASDFQKLEYGMKRFSESTEAYENTKKWTTELGSVTIGIKEVQKSFLQLQSVGLKPTEGQIKGLIGYLWTVGRTGKEQLGIVTKEMANLAQLGNVGIDDALKEFNRELPFLLQAYQEQTGKTLGEIFLDFKKRSVDFASLFPAALKYAEKHYSGAVKDMGAFWDVLLLRMESRWELFRKNIMDSGPFKNLNEWLETQMNAVDRLAADGTFQKWAEEIGASLVRLGKSLGIGEISFEKLGEGVVNFVKSLEKTGPAVKNIIDLLGDMGKGLSFLLQQFNQLDPIAQKAMTYGLIGTILFGTQAGVVIGALSAAADLAEKFKQTDTYKGWLGDSDYGKAAGAIEEKQSGFVSSMKDRWEDLKAFGRYINEDNAYQKEYGHHDPNDTAYKNFLAERERRKRRAKEFVASAAGMARAEEIRRKLGFSSPIPSGFQGGMDAGAEGYYSGTTTYNGEKFVVGSARPGGAAIMGEGELNALNRYNDTLNAFRTSTRNMARNAELEGLTQKDRSIKSIEDDLENIRAQAESMINSLNDAQKGATSRGRSNEYAKNIKEIEDGLKKAEQDAEHRKKMTTQYWDERNTINPADVNQDFENLNRMIDQLDKMKNKIAYDTEQEGLTGTAQALRIERSRINEHIDGMLADINMRGDSFMKAFQEIGDKLSEKGKILSPEVEKRFMELVKFVESGGVQSSVEQAKSSAEKKRQFMLQNAEKLFQARSDETNAGLLADIGQSKMIPREDQLNLQMQLLKAQRERAYYAAEDEKQQRLIVDSFNAQIEAVRVIKSGSFADGWQLGLKNLQATFQTTAEFGVSAFETLKGHIDGAASAFSTFVSTGKFEWRDFMTSMIADWMNLMSQRMFSQFFFGEKGKSGLMGQVGTWFRSVKSALGFAGGGWINEPVYGIGASGRTYTLGENESEFVTPRSKMGSGSGSKIEMNNTFHITAPSGPNGQIDQEQMSRLGSAITTQLENKFIQLIERHKLNGGALARR